MLGGCQGIVRENKLTLTMVSVSKFVGRVAISTVLLIVLLTGCASSKSATPEPTTSITELNLDISFSAWRGAGEGPNSCTQGPAVADFLREGASVRVYDEANGDLLASGRLTITPNEFRYCYYSSERLKVPRVDFYRTVIDGRRTYISSFVDLKVTAEEFRRKIALTTPMDLFLVEEYGWP